MTAITAIQHPVVLPIEQQLRLEFVTGTDKQRDKTKQKNNKPTNKNKKASGQRDRKRCTEQPTPTGTEAQNLIW